MTRGTRRITLLSMKQPNILLITSDQQHWRTLGSINPAIKTPHLDRLARLGVRFDRAYCPNPTCTPTRASIITGQYPSSHGAYTLGTKLPEDQPTVGAMLHDAGYRTSLIGKAHFQPLVSTPDCTSVESYPILRDLSFWRTFNERHTPWYGFDHVELARMHADEGHVGQHYALWMEAQGFADWREYFRPPAFGPKDTPRDGARAPTLSNGPGYGWRDPMTWALPDHLHYTTWTGQRTIAMIEDAARTGAPFFCWSSYHDPHPPYCVPEPWASMYRPEDMHDQIGQFVEGEFDDMSPPYHLTREEKPDTSRYNPDGKGSHGVHSHLHDRQLLLKSAACYYGMISFMDHWIGQTLDALERTGLLDDTLIVFTSDHGHFLGQHGLIAKGPFHYEDVIRVPFIAAFGDRLPRGRTSDQLTPLVDLAPPFLHAAGIDTPLCMQGRSQLDAWVEPTRVARSSVIVENHHNADAVHLRTLVTATHKLTVWRGRPEWGELFDLVADPQELRNLYHDPAATKVKQSMLEQFLQADLEREPAPVPRVAGA